MLGGNPPNDVFVPVQKLEQAGAGVFDREFRSRMGDSVKFPGSSLSFPAMVWQPQNPTKSFLCWTLPGFTIFVIKLVCILMNEDYSWTLTNDPSAAAVEGV